MTLPINRALLDRLDLAGAVALELSSSNRLLPSRWDYQALASQPSSVETWLLPQLRRNRFGRSASIVLANKEWRGTRPLHVMTLEDRVLYRALVELISQALPQRLRSRAPFEEFQTAPLDVSGARFISKTDVTSYYEYVDHDLLCAELIAQTGEELAVEALADLLASVLGRRVGLPQAHPASDVLGDTYIDPVRRRLLRRGHAVFTYSDDFRIASPTLGTARAAIEACAMEVRTLGLVLNERKTYTYGLENYRKSLTSFADAEQRLFTGDDSAESFDGLAFLIPGPPYGDANGDTTIPMVPSNSTGENEVTTETNNNEDDQDDKLQRLLAAQRAWELWEREEESEEVQASQAAAITQSLLGRALPVLGEAGDPRPLEWLTGLLRFEPGLTPQVAAYLDAYGRNGLQERNQLRKSLNEVTKEAFPA
ncbi:reverse transcriptase domain-containing protein [Nonomuraea wenchangensis]|uniref:reverse transcriptase domain-containing protein n=1 Tax=Nonomuraea wenchangensis TaxID=568860 RepID=UPI003331045C